MNNIISPGGDFLKLYFQIPLLAMSDYYAGGGFALAHLVNNDPRYSAHFQHRNYVILDNGIHELGQSVDTDALLQAFYLIWPRWVIAPDTMFDYRATREALEKFVGIVPQSRVLPVLQYKNPEEFNSFHSYLISEGYKAIALPYRSPRAAHLSDLKPGIHYHFLGLKNLSELEYIARGTRNISWSIDTGKPFRAAQNGGIVDGPKLDMYQPCNSEIALCYIQHMVNILKDAQSQEGQDGVCI